MTPNTYLRVPPDDLRPNPWNSNVVGPEMEARLDESIRRLGFYKPVIVREIDDGVYEILGGEHRARSAVRLGLEDIPVVSVGFISDTQAKSIGVADNANYGEDDTLKLASILRDIGGNVEDFLPYSSKDLADIFAVESLNFDDLGIDEHDESGSSDIPSLAEKRPAMTHELMRFKVPVEDREAVQKLIDRVIKSKGLGKEEDSLVAAGMALVEITNAAKELI